MASATPPPAPITSIDLGQFAETVDNARGDLNTGLVATSNDGWPDLSMRGSLLVLDADHLAWWERDKRTLRFYGEARIVTDEVERERIWERVVQLEKDMDPEKRGIAVVMRVDHVRAGPADIQRR